MLTDRQIRMFKPEGKDRLIADGGGLYIRVMVSGNKAFVLRQKRLGRTKWAVIGKYPDMSLADARKIAEDVLGGSEVHSMKVSQAVEAYMAHVKLHYKRPDLIEDRLTRDVIHTIGEYKLQSVTRKDLAEVLQAIVDRGSPVQANRTLADIKHLFAYCTEKGWIPSDPAAGITRKVVGGREKPRERTLSDIEITDFIKVLNTRAYAETTKSALWLMLLTGQRASEVLGLVSAEVDGVWWTIPKERTKSKRPHKVYLSPQSRALVKNWVPTNYDHRTLDRAVLRMGLGFTPHDLRRTMATRLADMGVAPHVIEKMLNHQMEGVMRVYNHAEYLPERRAAWRLWGLHIAKLRRAVRRRQPSASEK